MVYRGLMSMCFIDFGIGHWLAVVLLIRCTGGISLGIGGIITKLWEDRN